MVVATLALALLARGIRRVGWSRTLVRDGHRDRRHERVVLRARCRASGSGSRCALGLVGPIALAAAYGRTPATPSRSCWPSSACLRWPARGRRAATSPASLIGLGGGVCWVAYILAGRPRRADDAAGAGGRRRARGVGGGAGAAGRARRAGSRSATPRPWRRSSCSARSAAGWRTGARCSAWRGCRRARLQRAAGLLPGDRRRSRLPLLSDRPQPIELPAWSACRWPRPARSCGGRRQRWTRSRPRYCLTDSASSSDGDQLVQRLRALQRLAQLETADRDLVPPAEGQQPITVGGEQSPDLLLPLLIEVRIEANAPIDRLLDRLGVVASR